MEKNILVPLDYSEINEEVVPIADKWAQRIQATLHFLHVSPPPMSGENDENHKLRFNNYLTGFDLKSPFEIHHRHGKSNFEIVDVNNDIKPDLIIMGAHSHTMLGRLFLGSNTDYVLHHTNCPVYVHKKAEDNNKIIVPLDYTDASRTLVHIADDWARQTNHELYFLHVDEYPEYGGTNYAMETGFYMDGDDIAVAVEDMYEKSHETSKLMTFLKEFIEDLNVTATHQIILKYGKPYHKIMELHKELDAGLIMMAAHSHTLAGRFFIGSNTDYVLHHTDCPMYVHKEKE